MAARLPAVIVVMDGQYPVWNSVGHELHGTPSPNLLHGIGADFRRVMVKHLPVHAGHSGGMG